MTVYFFKTTNRAFAEDQWKYLDNLHSKGYASVRCMIPGKRKPWVKCPTTVSCAKCPHKADRKPPIISWDKLISTGYEPVEGAAPDEAVLAKMEYQASFTQTINNTFQSSKDFVSESHGAKLLPDLLYGIHFRCVWRDMQQGDVFRDDQSL